MSDIPTPAADPPTPAENATGLPPLPKPEELTSLSQFFGILRGRIDFERTLAEIRRERDEWDGLADREIDGRD